jgi:ATP-dependent Clp protease ATP-binding subunit ClpA
MGIFQRCTAPARRAIFFARAITIFTDAREITADHLLSGIMWEDNSRAQTIFRLQECFPLYRGCPWKNIELSKEPTDSPPLANESKRILAWTVREAALLADYWIDTEHLLLGILCESSCTAAGNLAKTGLTLAKARRAVNEHRSSRPNYGPAPLWWRLRALPAKVMNQLRQSLTSSANSKL